PSGRLRVIRGARGIARGREGIADCRKPLATCQGTMRGAGAPEARQPAHRQAPGPDCQWKATRLTASAGGTVSGRGRRMTQLVRLEGLTRRFGDLVAVDGISLDLEEGEVLGFLGPNGAGKSTTMKMTAGFLEPDVGRAIICGHDVVAEPKAARRVLGYLPEGAPAYGEMTPRDFLKFVAEVRGLSG